MRKGLSLNFSKPKVQYDVDESDIDENELSLKNYSMLKRFSRGASKEVYLDEEKSKYLIIDGMKEKEYEINKQFESIYKKLNKLKSLSFKIPRVLQRGFKFYIERVQKYDFHFKVTTELDFIDQKSASKYSFEMDKIKYLTDKKVIYNYLKATGEFFAILKITNRSCTEFEILMDTETNDIQFFDFELCNGKFEGLPKIIKDDMLYQLSDSDYEYYDSVLHHAYEETIMAWNTQF